MTDHDCEAIRDLLPDWITGELGPDDVEAAENHLDACEGCGGEADVLRVLIRGRPEPPPGLEGRIQARVREEFGARVIPLPPRRHRVPAWTLSAAALLVLALGTSRLWNPNGQDGIQDPILVANQEPLPEAWLWDDGMVAGALVFDGLSDEDLEALLEEFGG
jgi:hypothetical protein